MSKVWLFQATPNRFRLDEYLRTKPVESRWLVVQYFKQIGPGDRAFIWRAQGKQNFRSGIVAEADVVGFPKDMPDHPNAVGFWVGSGDRTGSRRRVDIKFTRTEGFISSDEIRKDPKLSGLAILKFSNATNFKVSDEEASQLSLLW